MMSMKKPKILFIMADQMAAPALPVYRPPNRQDSSSFGSGRRRGCIRKRLCNSPLCAPSRFSMLSGRLPSRIGAYDNAACFSTEIPTFAHYLRALDFDKEVTHCSVRKIYDLARSEDKRPFLLLVSFTHLHDPSAITPEYWK
jgi:arylsulfatase A-like enzyme